MSASFKNGAQCTKCQSTETLELNGSLICMVCGWEFGQDPDQHIPDEVGEVISAFVREALFRKSWDQGHMITRGIPADNYLMLRSVVNLPGRASCKLQWFERLVEKLPGPPENELYTPGQSGYVAPEVENLLRIALEQGFFVTELSKEGKFAFRYARLTKLFRLKEGIAKAFAAGRDLEDVEALVVRFEVMWLDPNNKQGAALIAERQ